MENSIYKVVKYLTSVGYFAIPKGSEIILEHSYYVPLHMHMDYINNTYVLYNSRGAKVTSSSFNSESVTELFAKKRTLQKIDFDVCSFANIQRYLTYHIGYVEISRRCDATGLMIFYQHSSNKYWNISLFYDFIEGAFKVYNDLGVLKQKDLSIEQINLFIHKNKETKHGKLYHGNGSVRER